MSRTSFGGLCALFALVGCGGQILGADGGTSNGDGSTSPTPTTSSKPDAGSPPVYDAGQPPAQCTPMQGGGTTSANGDCTVNAAWACGDTKYSVDCSCPAKQCTCSQYTANGGSGTMVPYYNGCPACTYSGQQLAQLCGFPAN